MVAPLKNFRLFMGNEIVFKWIAITIVFMLDNYNILTDSWFEISTTLL